MRFVTKVIKRTIIETILFVTFSDGSSTPSHPSKPGVRKYPVRQIPPKKKSNEPKQKTWCLTLFYLFIVGHLDFEICWGERLPVIPAIQYSLLLTTNLRESIQVLWVLQNSTQEKNISETVGFRALIESKGFRFGSTWELAIYSLPHACDKTKYVTFSTSLCVQNLRPFNSVYT